MGASPPQVKQENKIGKCFNKKFVDYRAEFKPTSGQVIPPNDNSLKSHYQPFRQQQNNPENIDQKIENKVKAGQQPLPEQIIIQSEIKVQPDQKKYGQSAVHIKLSDYNQPINNSIVPEQNVVKNQKIPSKPQPKEKIQIRSNFPSKQQMLKYVKNNQLDDAQRSKVYVDLQKSAQ